MDNLVGCMHRQCPTLRDAHRGHAEYGRAYYKLLGYELISEYP